MTNDNTPQVRVEYSGVFLQCQKMDRQLLRQKVRQRISVMKANTLYVSRELAF